VGHTREKEKVIMKINTSVALKAGLIGAAAGLLAALIGRIPCWGGIGRILGFVVALGTGALYVYMTPTKEDLVGGALGGGVAGAIAGFTNGLIAGVLDLIFGTVGAASTLLGGQEGAGVAAAVQAGATVGNVLLGIIGGVIGGAVLGAIGGLIYSAIKK
jgi:hypothetical protein